MVLHQKAERARAEEYVKSLTDAEGEYAEIVIPDNGHVSVAADGTVFVEAVVVLPAKVVS